MNKLPGPLNDVVAALAALPGLGPKSALRIGLTFLQWPREKTVGLGEMIVRLRENLCLCSRCAGISESEVCSVCSDPSRDSARLCLVSEWDSLLALEEAGIYKGLYMVLGGLLSPVDNVRPAHLEFSRFADRLAEGEVKEVILALGTTLDAESTASYIKNIIDRDYPHVSLTRLAQGMPVGSEVKYIDRETLKQSLLHRQEL